MIGIPAILPFSGAESDAALEELRRHPVLLRRPARQTSPMIFASPHSGRLYPAGFARQTRLDPVMLRRSEDAFVDELFDCAADAGAPFVGARFPRAFIDANRAPGEIDASMFDGPVGCWVGPRTPRVAAGLGVIPRIVRDGVDIYAGRLPGKEVLFRFENFYRPYHVALARLVAETRDLFGVAVVIDCHSMPAPAKGTGIVIGDCYGESAASALVAEVHRVMTSLG